MRNTPKSVGATGACAAAASAIETTARICAGSMRALSTEHAAGCTASLARSDNPLHGLRCTHCTLYFRRGGHTSTSFLKLY